MNEYKLYIKGNLADLDSTEDILFQKQRTDYTNPTIVKNSFTKTVKLPGTNNNNQIFNNIWKLDRVQFDGGFNPSKREEFLLMKNGNLVEKGYIKLDKVVWDGSYYTYETTLYGELGNVLYGLSYIEDEDTGEVREMTLGDLSTLGSNTLTINRTVVTNAWKRLNGDQSSVYELFDTINFAVCYDGIPSANNFDTKKVWCSVDRIDSVTWGNEHYNTFPSSKTVDNVTYTTVPTSVPSTDPQDKYGLLELTEDVTPLEARDLRAYLLRPVVRLQKIFAAISSYLNTTYGYTLDYTDAFFSTDEFTKTWMTLPMFYELNPDVQTNTVFTRKELFAKSVTPASYLISYCKIYGIYMDIDIVSKTLKLNRLPNFFQDKINTLILDKSKEVKITPLSFDKAIYSFDMGEGEGEFLKNYKEQYEVDYGSKYIYTGYRFDAESSPYIDNNIYKEAVDALEQSSYYRYSGRSISTSGSTLFISYPQTVGLAPYAKKPTYKLFNMSSNTTYDGEMVNDTYTLSGSTLYWLGNTGYEFVDNKWAGLKENIFQDGFPKVQLHSEDNKSIDGSNVLMQFNGFYSVSYGNTTKQGGITKFVKDTAPGNTNVNYLLSDDWSYLYSVIGTNCYYDNPDPDEADAGNYITQIDSLPSFTRSKYSYSVNSTTVPSIHLNDFDQITISPITAQVTITAQGTYYFTTSVTSATGRKYPYIRLTNIPTNHQLLAASLVQTSYGATIAADIRYTFPDLIGSTLINKTDFQNTTSIQCLGALLNSGTNTGTRYFTPMSTYSVSSTVYWDTYGMILIDLTALGLDDKFTTAQEALDYFGLSETKFGFNFELSSTLDFSVPKELYVPACTTSANIGVYNQYWKKYINDLYSVNTRVFEAYCYIDNIDEVFREFYYYDNSLWILSKVTDWNIDTHKCKATFVKVNDKDNYLS